MVVSAQAETAVFQANELRRFGKARSRSWASWRRVQATQDRLLLELALPRATGAAEDFLLMRATDHLKPELLLSMPPPRPADLETVRLREAAKGFNKLKKIWREDLGQNIELLTQWTQFAKWRQLRHVLVHRLGSWQPGLDPQPSLADRIEQLGEDPEVFRGLVPLGPADLEAAIEGSISFVLEADAASRT